MCASSPGQREDRVSPKVACAVLAAGGSRRLGHPKQLALHRGRPLVRSVAERVCRSRVAAVAVVVGAHAEPVRRALAGLHLAIVASPDWQRGLAESIRTAVAWASERRSDALLITLADQPRLSVEHLNHLIAEFWRSGLSGLPAASFYARKCAVPALFPRRLFGALARLRGDYGASSLLNDGRPVRRVSWSDGQFDVDSVESERRLLA
ncbi:MAG TPA: nucleotidyltransferase family protein [Polyangiaceae bacterium]|nr:nucleotidyltransferase family protein [Polyangiaceae bacterium]